jgi:hypothetical protein
MREGHDFFQLTLCTLQGADCLLIAAKQNPSAAMKVLFPHLGLGKPFVIHSPTIEPLMECRAMIAKHVGSVLDLTCTVSPFLCLVI